MCPGRFMVRVTRKLVRFGRVPTKPILTHVEVARAMMGGGGLLHHGGPVGAATGRVGLAVVWPLAPVQSTFLIFRSSGPFDLPVREDGVGPGEGQLDRGVVVGATVRLTRCSRSCRWLAPC